MTKSNSEQLFSREILKQNTFSKSWSFRKFCVIKSRKEQNWFQSKCNCQRGIKLFPASEFNQTTNSSDSLFKMILIKKDLQTLELRLFDIINSYFSKEKEIIFVKTKIFETEKRASSSTLISYNLIGRSHLSNSIRAFLNS